MSKFDDFRQMVGMWMSADKNPDRAAVSLWKMTQPRTITTAEELDSLDTGTVVLDHTGDVLKLAQRGWLSTDDEDVSYVIVPAIVLYEPKSA